MFLGALDYRLDQGDQRDGAETNQGVHCCSAGAKTRRNAGAAQHDSGIDTSRQVVVPGWEGRKRKGSFQPNIGYGTQLMEYASGKTREFYQIGLSANTTGISVYIMGLADKKYLAETFGKTLGKASVTGYCIKFKKLADIKIDVLKTAIQSGIGQTS